MQGNQLPENHPIPDIEYFYFQFAERFGWTPAQVNDQPGYLLDWLLAIGNLKDEITAEQKDASNG